jgi:hypothetical protein
MPSTLHVFRSVKMLKSVINYNSIFGYGFSPMFQKDGANLMISLDNMETEFKFKQLFYYQNSITSVKPKAKRKHK